MKHKHHGHVLLLMGLLVLSPVWATAEVERKKEGDRIWSFTVDHGKITLTSGRNDVPSVDNGAPAVLVVPSRIGNRPVVALGDFAFSQLQGVEEIVLPETVVWIGAKAFAGSRNLRKVVFPEALRSIDSSKYVWGTFSACPSLEEIVFLGPPPEIRKFGVSMDGIVRYTEKYRTQWERYLDENGIPRGEIVSAESQMPAKNTTLRDVPSRPDDFSSESGLAPLNAQAPMQNSGPVPVGPIDASSVTILPSDGIPVVLRNKASEFAKKIVNVNKLAADKYDALRTQLMDGFERGIAKAQAAGDIDTVLVLKSAKEQIDSLSSSADTTVKRAIAFREKRKAEIESARLADALKAAKEFNDELEKIKKTETTKGNFDTAKALADHQKKLVAWVRSLQSRAPNSADKPQRDYGVVSESGQSVDEWVNAEPVKTVVVIAKNSQGNSIGTAKQGDRFVIQYESGTWTNDRKNCPPISPDVSRIGSDRLRCVIIQNGNPGDVLAEVPGGTKDAPFVFEVPETGEYSLRMMDNENYYHDAWYGDNSGQIRYVIKHQIRRPR